VPGVADDDLLLALAGIELAAAAVHDAVLGTGLLDPAATAMVTSFAEHHRAHAAAYVERRTGGDVPEADPDAVEALLAPVFGSADAATLLQGARTVEAAMTATAIDACGQFDDQDVAALAARIGSVEARHQSALASAVSDPSSPEVGTAGSLLDA